MEGKHLMLWGEADKTAASIAQFSSRDAAAFQEYEALLDRVREVVQPLLDGPMPTIAKVRTPPGAYRVGTERKPSMVC